MLKILGLSVIVALVFLGVTAMVQYAKRRQLAAGACPGENCMRQLERVSRNCQK